jgi:hypothetical protein
MLDRFHRNPPHGDTYLTGDYCQDSNCETWTSTVRRDNYLSVLAGAIH